MRTIASDRLLLRPWRDEDADFLLDLESRWEVVRFLGTQPTIMNNREDALASAAVLDDAFRRGLTRVVAVTDPDNRASQAVCRRLGMTHVGRTTRYYDAPNELFEKLAG
ncbi:GNAT family N-acetyltransferase [Micromonospora sp. NPDC004551]|uniref:GNAT family N-acetyltransferase n=1 Tax=Micromonospora sp. NPDC004551 TaxID=3154284 RepID=UPI0033A52DF3